ncbi:heme-binding protein [Herbaspirillum sp. ST 5-3]|uniref:GlcG/HbpS family heme-binding protein n=1 Tax=Oxalobacteraceae TaxID=75682 RepID=UPI0010A2C904|nr:heme-binding protein [Herbaspirillum sp. ST 5-3]
MKVQYKLAVTLAFFASAGTYAAEATYAIKLMTPETALKAAQAGLKKCRDGGYQVAIAVVDRTGQTQVVLRDRFAGMHTPEAAVNKAWTAVSFKSNTSQFAESTQSGKESSGIRSIPRVLAIGGGLMIEAGGTLYGGIGVSGAPNGSADDACAKAGIDAIAEELEF